jgi:ABC-type transport system substrate-binding protein
LDSPKIPTTLIPRQPDPTSAASSSPVCATKLFDIDEDLKVVPQLALSHETSADGKAVTIKLRPGVKFHDGEPFDAAAAKFTLDRHMMKPGSFRKAELAQVDKVEVVDPLTIPPAQGAVLATRRATHGSRGHDGEPQGGDRGR